MVFPSMNSHATGSCQLEAVPYVFLTFTHSEFKISELNYVVYHLDFGAGIKGWSLILQFTLHLQVTKYSREVLLGT